MNVQSFYFVLKSGILLDDYLNVGCSLALGVKYKGVFTLNGILSKERLAMKEVFVTRSSLPPM